MLKVNEVADRLRVSVSTVYNLVETGQISCYRIGKGRGAIRFTAEDVAAYLETAKVATAPAPPPLPRKKHRHLT